MSLIFKIFILKNLNKKHFILYFKSKKTKKTEMFLRKKNEII